MSVSDKASGTVTITEIEAGTHKKIRVETLEAVKEGDKIIESGKARFTSAEDMLRELKK
jgi:uncharacterized Zn finger protein